MSCFPALRRPLPGLLLCTLVAAAALLLERAEHRLFGQAWLEALVLAILLGMGWRALRGEERGCAPGIDFAAHRLLEAAVALTGAMIGMGAVAAMGAALLLGIVATVVIAIAASFALGRAAGLSTDMALLIACGNAICGNSAIAAVAPAIEAEGEAVATAMAFTAVLGVGVVLLLAPLAALLGLAPLAGGALAGLTVYAVPQVVAAAAPMGSAAAQLGMLVKLARVLMLGPVVAGLSLLHARRAGPRNARAPQRRTAPVVPRFILVFLALMGARSAGLLPEIAIDVAQRMSMILTVVAMAGLGLGVDLRSVAAAGPRVAGVVIASLLMLGAVALLVLRLCHLA